MLPEFLFQEHFSLLAGNILVSSLTPLASPLSFFFGGGLPRRLPEGFLNLSKCEGGGHQSSADDGHQSMRAHECFHQEMDNSSFVGPSPASVLGVQQYSSAPQSHAMLPAFLLGPERAPVPGGLSFPLPLHG